MSDTLVLPPTILVGEALLDAFEKASPKRGSSEPAPPVPTNPDIFVAPKGDYVDFTEGLEVTIVTTSIGVDNVISKYDRLLEKTDRLLLAVDTETTAQPHVAKRYELAQNDLAQIKGTFDALNAKDPDYSNVKRRLDDQRKQVNKLAKEVQKAGLSPQSGQVRLIQFIAKGDDEVFVVDMWAISALDKERLAKLLGDPRIVWVCHNAYFDVKMLVSTGIKPANVPHCTLLQSHALEPLTGTPKKLSVRCRLMLGKEPSKELQASDWARQNLDPAQIRYGAGDAVATLELFGAQFKEMRRRCDNPRLSRAKGNMTDEDPLAVYELLRGSIPAVTEVHLAGFGFDPVQHKIVADDYLQRAEIGKKEVIEAFKRCSPLGAPVVENPGSAAQISAWIQWAIKQGPGSQFGGSSQEWPRTPTGSLAVGKEELALYGPTLAPAFQDAVKKLAEWKKIQKLSDTLGHEFARWVNSTTNRIHGNFRIGTETMRFSVTDPALQTISRESDFRKLFKPRPGYKFVICDYGQIEVRVAACLAQDQVLLDAIDQGVDMHALIAFEAFRQHKDLTAYFDGTPEQPGTLPQNGLADKHLFDIIKHATTQSFWKALGKWMRQAAKTTVFCTLFGGGKNRVSAQLRATGLDISPAVAGGVQKIMFSLFTGLSTFMNKCRLEAQGPEYDPSDAGTGLCWTPYGSVYAPESRNYLYTKSVNTPVQGGAAEIMLTALRCFPRAWGELDAKLVHIVHDELVAEVREDQVEEAKAVMIKAMTWAATHLFPTIPQHKLVEGSIGDSWGDK